MSVCVFEHYIDLNLLLNSREREGSIVLVTDDNEGAKTQ